jgi:outer membrane protein assembly factor BamA
MAWSPRAAAAPPGAQPATRSGDTPEGAELTDDDDGTRLIRIERIEVTGLQHVARRQVDVVLEQEGLRGGSDIMWPEDARVRRARQRLNATGFFKSVTLLLEPVQGRQDAAALVVDVVERSTVSVDRLYLGNSALTPFRGGVGLTERNFAGRGVLLGGSFIWSSLPSISRGRRQQSYAVFAEAPQLSDAPLGVLGGVFVTSAAEPYRVSGEANDPAPSHFRAFDYTRAGGVFGVTFPIQAHLRLGLDYRFERVSAELPSDPVYTDALGATTPVELDVKNGDHRLTVARVSLAYDGRQQSFLSGKGAQVGVDVQLSSPGLGSQYEYAKMVALGAYTLRLPWRHWLTPRAQAGQIIGSAPRFEQFYAGDLSAWTPGREESLRFSTRNPIDVFGTGIDTRTFGTMFARFDLEYVWPVFRRTRNQGIYGGDLFFSLGVFTLVEDAAGRARRREAEQRVAPTGFNADLGLRLDTALGTLKLTVGNVMRRTPL